jgi:arylsulfatase
VTDNVIFPANRELDPAIPTLGSIVRAAGYRTSYVGKWHLSHAVEPDLEAYGFSDWQGNDRHFMGWAGTGWQYDPIIADQGVEWLHDNAGATDRPWFLVVALVNPHDVMWFPIDQPSYQEEHREEFELTRSFLAAAAWKEDDPPRVHRAVRRGVRRASRELRRRPVHEACRTPAMAYEQQHTLYGRIDRDDKQEWLRHLDYYWRLHQEGDKNLGAILGALDASGPPTTPRSSSPPTTATCAAPTACAARGRSCTRRSCGCRCTSRPGITTPGTTTDARHARRPGGRLLHSPAPTTRRSSVDLRRRCASRRRRATPS